MESHAHQRFQYFCFHYKAGKGICLNISLQFSCFKSTQFNNDFNFFLKKTSLIYLYGLGQDHFYPAYLALAVTTENNILLPPKEDYDHENINTTAFTGIPPPFLFL